MLSVARPQRARRWSMSFSVLSDLASSSMYPASIEIGTASARVAWFW